MSDDRRGVRETMVSAIAALMGVSAFSPRGPGYGPEIDDHIVTAIREALGGQLQPILRTKLRWYLDDLETCQHQADDGYLYMLGKLWRAMKRDGMLRGLLETRTSGLLRLPRKFYGDQDLANELKADNGTRSVFDDMHPPAELALLVADGIGPGVGIAERVPVPGRDFPVLVRLDPEFLIYRWAENRWYFSSVAGMLPIDPGNGRWVLHVPGGRIGPWNSGSWAALGRSFINKEHAMLNRTNYGDKLANPARVAYAPQAATEQQKQSWFAKVMAWGTNTVFGMTPGYEVKLIESNGVGYEVFQKIIDTSDLDYMVSLVGQIVTTTGGTGFSNQDVQQQIRTDYNATTADAIAYTLNTQSLPPWVVSKMGVGAISRGPGLKYQTEKPKDLKAVGESLKALSEAIQGMNEGLAEYKKRLALEQLLEAFGAPVEDAPDDVLADRAKSKTKDAPDLDEAREKATQGDEQPIEDERKLRRAA